MDIKVLADNVSELSEKLKDGGYKMSLIDSIKIDMQSKGDYSKSLKQDHKIIHYIISHSDDTSFMNISETTIWRLLKIKEESPTLYRDVAAGKIKIKTAFNKLYSQKEKAAQKQQNERISFETENIDLTTVLAFLKKVNLLIKNKQIVDYETNKTIENIDKELFIMRKALQRIYNNNND